MICPRRAHTSISYHALEKKGRQEVKEKVSKIFIKPVDKSEDVLYNADRKGRGESNGLRGKARKTLSGRGEENSPREISNESVSSSRFQTTSHM